MYHTIFFDLDNTLYPKNSGIWELIGKRINLYITEVLKIPDEEVISLRKYCRENFSTTLMGLQSLYGIDEFEYLAFVHDIDLAELLEDNGKLKTLISQIPHRKIIFTNSDTTHANNILNFFGIQAYFDLIVDVLDLMPTVKPDPAAYKIALSKAKLETPEGCIFIDDMLENIESAEKLGFYSILVGDAHNSIPCIDDIFSLPKLLEVL